MADFYCIGVDFKTTEVSVALRGPETLRVTTRKVPAGLPMDRTLWAVGGLTEALAISLGEGIEVACAIVEQPMGSWYRDKSGKMQKSVPKAMYMTAGVIIERLAGAGIAAVDIQPAKWRKEILGNGNLKREEAKKQAVEFAQSLGYEGDSDDEADAICLAEYGIRTVTVGP